MFFATFLGLADARAKCPGSFSPIHAGARLTMTFTNTCAEVAEEIQARAAANRDTWKDPHNDGTYTLEKQGDYIQVKRVTKNRQFTDRAGFTLSDNGSGCLMEGCSESQGISAADSGTNICNMYSLVCGPNDCAGGNCCKTLKHDLQGTMGKQQCFPLFLNCPGNAAKTANTCLKNPNVLEDDLRQELQENAIMLQRMGAFLDFPDEESTF